MWAMQGATRCIWVCYTIILIIVVIAVMGVGVEGADDDEYGSDKKLVIMVPRKVGFKQFASAMCTGAGNRSCTSFSGFAVEVFQTCISRLRPQRRVRYKFVAGGNGTHEPSYDDMVYSLQNKEVDGIVGDLTINAKRMELVDFTHPYIHSTLVLLVPFSYEPQSTKFVFLQPFTKELWGSIVALFISTGLVIFILEHQNPYFHEQGLGWKIRLTNVFWFTSMTLFFTHRANISTRLGRILTISWLMVVLVFASSYTASLTSMLAPQVPVPTIKNFMQLEKSNLSIGYQDGSFVPDYANLHLNIRRERFQSLGTEEEYEESLRNKSVIAILEELPYVQAFINSECSYTKLSGQVAYFGGFGFAFRKNSSLTKDVSLEILKLEQSGELQEMRDRWLGVNKCNLKSDFQIYIPFENFSGLIIIVGILYFLLISFRFFEWIFTSSKED